jgi:hypothetical protein
MSLNFQFNRRGRADRFRHTGGSATGTSAAAGVNSCERIFHKEHRLRWLPAAKFPPGMPKKFAFGVTKPGFQLCRKSDRVQRYSGALAGVASPCSFEREDPMLPTFRPTPTCTRFQATIEMPCLQCGVQMRLALIEPQGPNYNLLTYRCVPCDSGESFLKAM